MVILQWYTALLLDVLLFRHPLAIDMDNVTPLVSVGVSLVSISLSSESIEIHPILLSLHQQVKASTVTTTLASSSNSIDV
jgi:hypothetical protein